MNGDVNVLPECLAQVGKAPGNPRQVLGRQVAAVCFVTGLAELCGSYFAGKESASYLTAVMPYGWLLSAAANSRQEAGSSMSWGERVQ